MKTKIIGLTLALSFFGWATCLAANPQMGTWKLNMSKSKLGREKARNNTVTYQSMFFQTKVTIDGTDDNGKPVHSEWTGRFDGKDYPVTGDSTSDARSYTKVNDHTLRFTVKNHGKAVATGQIVVAPDGKSRTVTATGTDAKGKKFQNLAVYDKQ